MGSREGLFLRWEIDAEMQVERRLKRKGDDGISENYHHCCHCHHHHQLAATGKACSVLGLF